MDLMDPLGSSFHLGRPRSTHPIGFVRRPGSGGLSPRVVKRELISSFATPLRSGTIVLLLFPKLIFILRHHQLGTTFFRTTPNKEDGRIKE